MKYVFLVLTLVMSTSAGVLAQIDKSIPITVTTNAGSSHVLTMRICDSAVDTVHPTDPCDVIVPPVPPQTVFDIRLRNSDNDSGIDASTDARKIPSLPSSSLKYDILYQIGSVNDIPITSMTLSWDPIDIASIPELTALTLKDNVTGTLIGPIDMMSQSQFSIDDSSPFWDLADFEVEMSLDILPLDLDLKVFLSGAYSGGSMRTDLNSSGVLGTSALSQPYSVSPWNYGGSESVSPSFFANNPDIVDWVLLRLYSGDPLNPPVTLAAETVAFLKSDGSILQPDGSNFASFTALEGFYYVGVFHRNHLPVFGGKIIDLRSRSASYDFTESQSKAFSTIGNPMRELSPGVFGLWGGDGDSNFSTTAFDFVNSFLPINGAGNGYNGGDFNMDGVGTAFDFLLTWLPANGKSAQFP